MLTQLSRIASVIEAISEWSGRAVSWLTVFMVIITFIVVILRYLFNIGWIALQESVTYLHVLVFMVGAAYTLRHDGHVRVDIFYQRMTPRKKAMVDLFGALCLLLPMALFILVESWGYVATSWSLLEGSPESGGIPAVFLLKSVILLMAVLVLLQGLSQAIQSALTLASPDGDTADREG